LNRDEGVGFEKNKTANHYKLEFMALPSLFSSSKVAVINGFSERRVKEWVGEGALFEALGKIV
jgi:hypothetical protein